MGAAGAGPWAAAMTIAKRTPAAAVTGVRVMVALIIAPRQVEDDAPAEERLQLGVQLASRHRGERCAIDAERIGQVLTARPELGSVVLVGKRQLQLHQLAEI